MKNKRSENNIVLEKSRNFWVYISKYYIKLKDKKYFEIASQLFKSGTSIWANISEAQWAVSKSDFINKLSIALKEAYETEFWFFIIEEWFWESTEELKELKNNLSEIISILTSIIKTMKEKK